MEPTSTRRSCYGIPMVSLKRNKIPITQKCCDVIRSMSGDALGQHELPALQVLRTQMSSPDTRFFNLRFCSQYQLPRVALHGCGQLENER